MPEWGEVMEAQRIAREAQSSMHTYAGQIEDGDRSDNLCLMIALAADALVCRQIASTIEASFYMQKLAP
jgi:hypothetical protein